MQKLLEFQKRVTPIVKDSTNPFYKKKYFDINSLLETIRPILNELGLLISQPLEVVDGKQCLRTQIADAKDGKILVDSYALLPENSDPQKMGATITYYRRYALQSMLCLEAEDDDGNTASGKTAPMAKPVPNANPVVKTATPTPAPKTPQAQTMAQAKQAVYQKDDLTILKTKLTKLGAKNEDEALKILEEKTGVPVAKIADIDNDMAKELLAMFD